MTKKIDKIDHRIIEYLGKNGPSFLGEVVKELKISYTTGLSRISSLKSKGIIRRANPLLRYEINSENK